MWPGKATCARDHTRHTTAHGAQPPLLPPPGFSPRPLPFFLLSPFFPSPIVRCQHASVAANCRCQYCHRRPPCLSHRPLPCSPSLLFLSLLRRQTPSMSPPSQDLDHLHPPPNHIFPFFRLPWLHLLIAAFRPFFLVAFVHRCCNRGVPRLAPRVDHHPPCFISLTFAIDFVRQHRRRPLQLLRSLSPPQPWPPLLILAATGVFPYLSVFFPPALLPLPYPSTTVSISSAEHRWPPPSPPSSSPLPTTDAVALLSGDVHHGLPCLSPASTIHHRLLLHADAGCRRDLHLFLLLHRGLSSPSSPRAAAASTVAIAVLPADHDKPSPALH